jgi:hypothetical protein
MPTARAGSAPCSYGPEEVRGRICARSPTSRRRGRLMLIHDGPASCDPAAIEVRGPDVRRADEPSGCSVYDRDGARGSEPSHDRTRWHHRGLPPRGCRSARPRRSDRDPQRDHSPSGSLTYTLGACVLSSFKRLRASSAAIRNQISSEPVRGTAPVRLPGNGVVSSTTPSRGMSTSRAPSVRHRAVGNHASPVSSTRLRPPSSLAPGPSAR